LGMVSIFVGSVLYDRQQRRREEAEERLQESALFLRESQAIANLGGWKLNPETGMLRLTDEMYRLLECPADYPLTRKSVLEFFDPADRDTVKHALSAAWKSGSGFNINCRMKTVTGRQFWAELRCTGLVENHSSSYLVGTLQDISAHKQTEEMLVAAREAAESSTRTKNELLAVISHELRTPLNGVIGGAQLLGMTELSKDQQEYLQMVVISAKNELALVNDLLDLASLDASEIKIVTAPFVLYDSIMNALVPHRTIIRERGLTFRSDISPALGRTVLGDSRRLTQVVSNLINNAIKFTPQGEISLKADLLERGAGSVTVRIVVSDTGIGIAPKDQQRIFEPFVQADMSHTRSYGGTGLGLSICSKLVERMGGTISLESEAGAGSRFTIELPFMVADPVAEPVPSKTAVKFTPTGSTVLVAEDNLINLKATSGMLRKMGYTVVSAADGKEALAHWMQGGIDVVLMDIQMPVMDGIEAMQFIRAREQQTGCHTPVVALTAHAMQEDRERLLKSGFDGYLAKPVEAQALYDEISRVLHTRSMNAI